MKRSRCSANICLRLASAAFADAIASAHASSVAGTNVPKRSLEVLSAAEQKVFAAADRIILNTNGARSLYARSYPAYAPKMTVIPNGYDRLNPADAREPVREPFRIVHVGAFYGSRTPDELLDVLERFEGDTEFVQIGSTHPTLERRSSARIRVIPQMKHGDALNLMRTASLLYLRQGWEPGVTDYIAVAAKSYEYLATGLPILAHCPPGDNAELIRRYAANSYVVTRPGGRELVRPLPGRTRFGGRAG